MVSKLLLLLSALAALSSAETSPGAYYSFSTLYGAHPYGVAPLAARPVPLARPALRAAPIAHAAPVAPPAYAHPKQIAAPVITSSQYHSQDELGNVEYGYENINSAKKESRDAYGNVAGAYSYIDATGVPKTVSYIADSYGFRVTGANNLPIAPADTPEVAYAKTAHFNAVNAAAAYPH